MKLNFRKVGEGSPVIVLHGLFGSSDNWLSIARKFSETHSFWLLDLRNHGQSPHSETHDYDSMVSDLNEFIEYHNLQTPIILGHSMGGKVAMKFAIDYPQKTKKLIVIDIAPKIYKPKSKYIVEALMDLDISQIKSRDEADSLLEKKIKHKHIRKFTLKNLYRKEDLSFGWRLNLASLNNNLETIGGAFDESKPFNKDTLFIKGELSNYILQEDFDLITKIFTNSTIKTIQGAGHWVHTDKPDIVYEIIKDFIS